jgi:hypothetical protein
MLALFSRSGFTEGLQTEAKVQGVLLIGAERFLGEKKIKLGVTC